MVSDDLPPAQQEQLLKSTKGRFPVDTSAGSIVSVDEPRRVCHHWSQTDISWISSLSLLMTSASYSIMLPLNCGCYHGSLEKS